MMQRVLFVLVLLNSASFLNAEEESGDPKIERIVATYNRLIRDGEFESAKYLAIGAKNQLVEPDELFQAMIAKAKLAQKNHEELNSQHDLRPKKLDSLPETFSMIYTVESVSPDLLYANDLLRYSFKDGFARNTTAGVRVKWVNGIGYLINTTDANHKLIRRSLLDQHEK